MPEIPPQPQPTSNKKAINWKRVLIVALVGAIVIGLGVLIFLILQPKEETPTTANKATPSAKKDETADWKTYTGKYYTFKYPTDWKIETATLPDELRLVSPDLVVDESGPLIIVKSGTMVKLYLTPGSDRDLKEYLHEYSIETTLGGEKAIRSSSDDSHTAYFVVNNGKFYQIPRLYPAGKQSEYEDIFNKILSTFKFLD
jgi:hypothetical protein